MHGGIWILGLLTQAKTDDVEHSVDEALHITYAIRESDSGEVTKPLGALSIPGPHSPLTSLTSFQARIAR